MTKKVRSVISMLSISQSLISQVAEGGDVEGGHIISQWTQFGGGDTKSACYIPQWLRR